jgi:hypothetical protein
LRRQASIIIQCKTIGFRRIIKCLADLILAHKLFGNRTDLTCGHFFLSFAYRQKLILETRLLQWVGNLLDNCSTTLATIRLLLLASGTRMALRKSSSQNFAC